MNPNNLVLATDSYKLNHWNQYPKGTEAVYSYFESRPGAQYDETVFFGLQSILKTYLSKPITSSDVEQAYALAKAHFGSEALFNMDGWLHILHDHKGWLPLRIKAVPEGTVVPVSNVLMTVENTCPKCYWLTNAMESILTHVWYPSTVATVSRGVKKMLASYLDRTADSRDGLPFMLHDFGYRGASSHETAALGGAGHLVNFKGTDTLPAMILALNDYDADLASLAFSVPATEHSVMTATGRAGEMDVVHNLLNEYPTGILSVVADSYDYYGFVEAACTTFKDRIEARDGVFVIRPDSVTLQHPCPSDLVAWTLNRLWDGYGGTLTSKSFKVLNPKVRVLWGDGIDPHGIEKICARAVAEGFSVENLVFGMGGGLLQKVNRDTQRFAFKSSAQKRRDGWHDVYKEPLDSSKASKRGRLALVVSPTDGVLRTLNEGMLRDDTPDVLQVVYENGKILTDQTFEDIRQRAELP